MKAAILGTGDVGKALAKGFLDHGHDVVLGTRDPDSERLRPFLQQHAGLRAVAPSEAAAWCDLAVLCTSWSGTENAVRLAGAANLAGKVVVDVTNPLRFSDTGPPGLAVCGEDSAGETVQRWLPESRVVKAWNIVGNPHMVDPDFPGGPPTMFIAGDDAAAKKTVCGILEDFGWDVSDLGGIEASRYIEGLAMVWILDYFRTGSGDHAVKMLRK